MEDSIVTVYDIEGLKDKLTVFENFKPQTLLLQAKESMQTLVNWWTPSFIYRLVLVIIKVLHFFKYLKHSIRLYFVLCAIEVQST